MKRLILGFALLNAGCSTNDTASTPDTGARQAVESFFTGLIQHDSRRSFELLATESKRKITAEQFARLADGYTKKLGFSATKVHIRACEEQDTHATAHVVLTGQSRRYEDGITLQREGERWVVVLPDNFGRKAR